MKECTETDKPLVSIVMATYNPRMDWLEEQLKSLNDQSYNNIELLVLDDCSMEVSLAAIKDCVEKCITRFPLEVYRNESNLGSTKTFEKLTMLAKGKYIAYCDQDDVWHKGKVETCVNEIETSSGTLVFSDVNIINGEGKQTADSITKVRRHHKFYSGRDLWQKLLFKNFVTGCTILIRAEDAKKAIPFCPYMIHDHWLALYSSVSEEIVFIKQPLVNYRIHENNQTPMMAGVIDKNSYLQKRIVESLDKFLWLQERFSENPELSGTIAQAIEWMAARRDNFYRKSGSIKVIWKYKKV